MYIITRGRHSAACLYESYDISLTFKAVKIQSTSRKAIKAAVQTICIKHNAGVVKIYQELLCCAFDCELMESHMCCSSIMCNSRLTQFYYAYEWHPHAVTIGVINFRLNVFFLWRKNIIRY